ncbi:type IV secretion system protein [Chordicoccus furentiruminis]|uniref:type IV secretion system protein n=1 Tax=Chordicoccus furentiruminis TaxID=2709410 RepID=UPI0023A8717F|nr:type IV secretion system protein [Chordicoccus furentiruminis]
MNETMWQQFMIQSMPMALKLPGWMTGIGSLIKDGIGQAANAMYETVLSPMLTWLGGIMFAQGRALLNCGFSIWKSCTQVALNFVQKNPEGQFGAWSIVSGSGVYGVFLAIAGSLTIFYFVAGWLKESIDIRSTFNLESMFKMFIRFAITISLVMNSMSLVRGINNASLALAHTIQITESDEKKQTVDQVFDSMEESLKSTGESEGSSWFSAGLIALIGGLVGMFTILVSGVELAITVIKRLFKVYMCIPFAPVALAGFAGGREFAQTGIAWLKTFTAYCLEAFVIALAIKLSFGLFASAALNFTIDSADITVQMMLAIFNLCMPMVATAACVKGADGVVRSCLGLD